MVWAALCLFCVLVHLVQEVFHFLDSRTVLVCLFFLLCVDLKNIISSLKVFTNSLKHSFGIGAASGPMMR